MLRLSAGSVHTRSNYSNGTSCEHVCSKQYACEFYYGYQYNDDQLEVLVEPDQHRRHVHEQGRGVEADHLDHAGRHAEGGRQGGAPARRRRQRHRRQDGSRGFPGGSAGDAGHEVPSRLDGDPHAHDSGAAAAGAG